MKIAIRNYLSGSFLLETEPSQWDAIVVLDSGLRESAFVKENSNDHLFLRFDDVTKLTSGKRSPTIQDVSAALDFASSSENLVVCCRAGQSRSATLAFAVAYANLGKEAALDLWNPKRHSPNKLVLELASQIIDDPAFTETYHQWLNDHSRISLMDYLDEIEEEYDQLEAAGARNRILAS